MPKAVGKIAVKTYEPSTYDSPPNAMALVEIHVTETFSGDIEGNAFVRFLQASAADGSASFCGIERVDGKIAGRRGSFLLQDTGSVTGREVVGQWFVVPGSGTGELDTLSGRGGFQANLGEGASWWLEYELG